MRIVGRLITILFIAVGFALPERRDAAQPVKMRDAAWFSKHSTELALVPYEDQSLDMVRSAILANCTMAGYAAPAILTKLMTEAEVRKAMSGCGEEPKIRKTETVKAAVTELFLRRQ